MYGGRRYPWYGRGGKTTHTRRGQGSGDHPTRLGGDSGLSHRHGICAWAHGGKVMTISYSLLRYACEVMTLSPWGFAYYVMPVWTMDQGALDHLPRKGRLFDRVTAAGRSPGYR